MVPVLSLWLPILVAAALIFVVSAILHTVIDVSLDRFRTASGGGRDHGVSPSARHPARHLCHAARGIDAMR